LQRYSFDMDTLLEAVGGLRRRLLLEHGKALNAANTALEGEHLHISGNTTCGVPTQICNLLLDGTL